MTYDLILSGGTVVRPDESFPADIGVRDGRIAAIGDLSGHTAKDTFDARGLHVLPGIIDEHTHSRDPGLTHKEDFLHMTRSAAAGGVTTVIEMPNSVPPVMDLASLRERVARLEPNAHTDFALYGMMLGDFNREHLADLARNGVVGFKFFWGYALDPKTLALVYNFKPGDDVVLPPGHGEIYESFRTIAETGLPVAIHAEDSAIIARLTERAAESGRTRGNDYDAFLDARPSFTEALTTRTGIDIARAAGVHLHVLHVTAKEAAAEIRDARARGQAVTAETCPHYLFLSADDFPEVGVDMKIYPPIRRAEDSEALWRALAEDVLQAVGSDHAPHTREEKSGDVWTAPAGACGVQTLLPLMLEGVAQGRLTLNRLAMVLSEAPARIWGLFGRKGCIQPGADADFTVVDMEAAWTIRREDLLSKNDVTPFAGRTVHGRPVATFVRGRAVMRDGKVVDGPSGAFVRPEREPQARW